MGCDLFFVRVRFDDLVKVVEHIVVGCGCVTDYMVRRKQSRGTRLRSAEITRLF